MEPSGHNLPDLRWSQSVYNKDVILWESCVMAFVSPHTFTLIPLKANYNYSLWLKCRPLLRIGTDLEWEDLISKFCPLLSVWTLSPITLSISITEYKTWNIWVIIMALPARAVGKQTVVIQWSLINWTAQWISPLCPLSILLTIPW